MTLPITCDNCGAKYKLPETFSGSHAKCQKCGSVIDVQKQRAAAAPAASAPAAAKPAAPKPAAAAKPAVDRSKAPAATPAKPAAAAGRARRGKDGDGEGAGEGRKRERGGKEAKKGNPMPLVLGAVGVVAIGVVAVLMMGKGDAPKPEPTKPAVAQAPEQPAATPPAAAPAAAAPAAAGGSAPAKPADAPAKPAEAPAKPAEAPAKPAEAPAAAAGSTPPAEAPANESGSATKRPWEKLRNPPQTYDQVTDPKSYPEVAWPEGVDDVTKAQVRPLVEDVVGGGRAGQRAKAELLKADYPSLFAIVERLRLLDYKSADDSMVAFELNKVLEEITAGLNARFEPCEATEQIPPAKAEWNTRTVKGWMDLLAQYPTAEAFKKARAERIKKQADK